MAAAVPDTSSAPQHSSIAPRISHVASEPLPAQASFKPQPRPHSLSPREGTLIAQLGPLASQHHASEYSRFKFGPKGSPLAYVPYSVQMPEHYQKMLAHQARCAELKAWWPHKPKLSMQALRLGCTTALDLQEQLSAAISTSIIVPGINNDRYSAILATQPHWHTSETHPIVISTIIPSELLSTISFHLQRSAERYPVIFNIPRKYLLDLMTPSPIEAEVPKLQQVPTPPPLTPIIPSRSPPSPSSTQIITKSLKFTSLFWVHPTVKRAFLGSEDAPPPTSKKRSRPASFVALSRPNTDGLTVHRPKALRNIPSPSAAEKKTKEPLDRVQTILPATSRNAAVVSVSVPDVPVIPPAANAKLLGNLYMSSCPGKKVRLDGPVRGRNTVYRDLRSDLLRIKGVGVACIVCCLDDKELEVLGVSWVEYTRVAHELGIDILRLPIPEGLPPMDPAVLDLQLTRLIDTYTLHGRAILVHCRGGVGRAGIIACCWMLKLGLCGWLQPKPDARERPPEPASGLPIEQVSRETLGLVKRLISVVRKRRSLKAVETYEQVKFLVEYVEFLRVRAAPTTSSPADFFADWDIRVE